MVVHRGEVWWADLGDPQGAAPGYRRPVVVVQAESFNRSRIETVVAIALTSNLRLADAPGNVVVPKRSSGLSKDSVANVSQLVTLDREVLTKRAAVLPIDLIQSINRGLRLVLEL